MSNVEPPPASVTDEKSPPFDLNAEAACLGSCLIDRYAWMACMDIVSRDDFYLHRHRLLWEAIGVIYERNSDVSGCDELLIESQLRAMKALDDAGGMGYVIQMLTTTPTSDNAEAYAELVRRGAVRRGFIDMASRMAQAAQDDQSDVDAILNKADAIYSQVERWRRHDETRTATAGDLAASVYERIERRVSQTEEPGIPTGYGHLDQVLDGFSAGQVITVAGITGGGKSVALMNFAANAARSGARVAFFTLEMSLSQYGRRLMSAETGIDHDCLRKATMTDSDYQLYMEAANRVSKWQLTVEERPRMTPLYLRRALQKAQRENGVDIAFIDYIQLMSSGNQKIDDTGVTARITECTHSIKEIASDFKIPIVQAAQLNRDLFRAGDKRPELYHLKDSSSIEHDSDIVLMLYRPVLFGESENYAGETELLIRKNRDGETGMVNLRFEGRFQRFVDIDITRIPLN